MLCNHNFVVRQWCLGEDTVAGEEAPVWLLPSHSDLSVDPSITLHR